MAKDLFGYSEDEVLGCKVDLILSREVVKLLQSYTLNRFEEQTSFENNRRNKVIGNLKDGTSIPISLSFSTIIETDQNFTCCIIRDLSNRQKSELELTNLRGIIDSSPSCVKLVSKDGALLRMNSVGLKPVSYTHLTLPTTSRV